MFGTLALAAAILFVVLALARLRGSAPAVIATGVPVAAALAALFAVLHWSAIADSRWLVGGVLLIAALALSLIKANRTLAIVALILGILGAALFGVAIASPARPALVLTPATTA